MMFKNMKLKIIKSLSLVLMAFIFIYCSKDGGDSNNENIPNKSIVVNPSSIDFSDTNLDLTLGFCCLEYLF